jgi:hypothetical protein
VDRLGQAAIVLIVRPAASTATADLAHRDRKVDLRRDRKVDPRPRPR